MKRLRDILIFLTAFWLLFSCSEDKGQMLRQLEMLEEANRADSVMNNDSLAEDLVTYFDKHGTPNERMRARYMLGRTYYDMGEQPRALETYLEAADCADTTASDCDYKVLSRIHAQSALIYNAQIQPKSQLEELRKAENYAWKACDTLQAIECYSQQAEVYYILRDNDSSLLIRERAADLYMRVDMERQAAVVLGGAVSSALNTNNIAKTKKYMDFYEEKSGFFDENGDIVASRRIYYYIKGKYYLAINRLDSAEYWFRKLLRDYTTLNHLIAGSKGLQDVFARKGISDSLSKYSSMAYTLNDSAYSTSEMQNIQRMKASYNYAHHKQIAEQQRLKATRNLLLLLSLLFLVIVLAIIFISKYRKLQTIALDFRLRNSTITLRFRKMARSNPPVIPTYSEWGEIRKLVEKEIPSFRERLKSQPNNLEDIDYDICILIRVFMSPIEISKLTQCSPSNVSNIRKRLLKRVFEREGGSEDFDDEIRKIY